MNKPLGIALVVAGIILLLMGYGISRALNSDGSQLFGYAPGDRSLWFLASGGLVSAVGFYLLTNRSRL